MYQWGPPMTNNQKLGERCICHHKFFHHEMQNYYPYRLEYCTFKDCECKKFESEGINVKV